MPIRPTDVLTLAESILNLAREEANVRSAVSRAYYAALHQAAQTFPDVQRIGNESSHVAISEAARVYGAGANPGRAEAQQVASLLPRMRRLRNLADYSLESKMSEKDAVGEIERAKLVISFCEEVLRRQDNQRATGGG